MSAKCFMLEIVGLKLLQPVFTTVPAEKVSRAPSHSNSKLRTGNSANEGKRESVKLYVG